LADCFLKVFQVCYRHFIDLYDNVAGFQSYSTSFGIPSHFFHGNTGSLLSVAFAPLPHGNAEAPTDGFQGELRRKGCRL